MHWLEDFVTKGGRRIHALIPIIGVGTLCIGFLILCIGAVWKDKAAFYVEIPSIGGCIMTVCGWIYNTGKTAQVAQDAPVKPNAP